MNAASIPKDDRKLYAKNFLEIAKLLPRNNERAIACAKWLQHEADKLMELNNA